MIIKAFALGLSTGVFCMGYCAPVLMGLLLSRADRGWRGNLKSIALFLGGRLIAYLAFGVITYQMGETFRGSLLFLAFFPVGEILLGGLMLVYGVGMNFPHLSFCQRAFEWSRGDWSLFLAGAFTGMNLCPPFILAVGTAMTSGSLLESLLFFFVFFVATSIYLLPFLFSGLASRSESIRTAASVVCGITGLWLLADGVRHLFAV